MKYLDLSILLFGLFFFFFFYSTKHYIGDFNPKGGYLQDMWYLNLERVREDFFFFFLILKYRFLFFLNIIHVYSLFFWSIDRTFLTQFISYLFFFKKISLSNYLSFLIYRVNGLKLNQNVVVFLILVESGPKEKEWVVKNYGQKVVQQVPSQQWKMDYIYLVVLMHIFHIHIYYLLVLVGVQVSFVLLFEWFFFFVSHVHVINIYTPHRHVNIWHI